MSRYLFLFIFGLAVTIFADDYRSFTDNDGRTIRAKILKVDKRANKVTVERDNKTRVTVPINIFSERDQVYITTWSSIPKSEDTKSRTANSEPKTTTTKLSKANVKKIGKEYAELIEKNPYGLYRFYDTSAGIPPNKTSSFYTTGPITKKVYAQLKNNSDTFFTLEVRNKGTSSYGESFSHGPYRVTALLTPSGKIKYETEIHPHPVEELTMILSKYSGRPSGAPKLRGASTYSSAVDYPTRFMLLLDECGAPPFRVETGPCRPSKLSGKARNEMREALKEVADWLLENGTSVDSSSPEIFIPEKAFSVLESYLKASKRSL